MRFNPAKCQIMHLARSKPRTKFYDLCGEILATVDNAKYLGVTISQDLTWHTQICTMAKKANSTLHLVSRNLHNCPRQTRALAYTTLVRPKMEYCSTVWDPHTQKDCNILERINRRATRVVCIDLHGYKQQDVSPTEQLQELGWKPLQQRRKEQRLTMMYRIDKELVAIPSDDLVEPTRHLKGHSRKFRELGSSCDTVKYSFYPRTIKQWNELSEEVVTSPNLDIFKKSMYQIFHSA